MDKSNRNSKNSLQGRQMQLYLNIAFFGVFACIALIFLLLAFDKIPKAKSHKKKNVVSTEAQSETPSTESVIPKETLAAETTLTISLMGDCTLGTDENFDPSTSFNAYYTLHDETYFFSKVKSILSADDLSIVNFEGTLTASETREDKTFAFKGAPEYASILTAGSIEAANLANNHSRDYGASSYTDTQTNLRNAGITTFGNEETAVIDVKGVKIGLIGIYELDTHLEVQSQLLQHIAKVQQEGADYIIVNFHWGNELETTPDSNQTTLAHAAIDAGADLVVGHHPHVMQGIESYKNKTIVYSLGNFCFGGNVYPHDFDTMIFQQSITFNTSKVLTQSADKIIPCSVSSESSYNNYQPTPAEGDEKTRIESKIATLGTQIPSALTSGATGNPTDGTTGGTADDTTGGSSFPTDTSDTSNTENNDSSGDTSGSSDSSSESTPETASDSSETSSANNPVRLFLPD